MAMTMNPLRVILLLVVVFGIGNLVLYYGQEYYHSNEIEQCKRLDSELTRIKGEIEECGRKIAISGNVLDAKKSVIGELLQKLRSPNVYYSNKRTYDSDRLRYENLLSTYNAEVGPHNALISSHKTLIANYSTKVEEYNKIAKTAYSRWYIIPVPGRTSKVRK